MVGEVSVPVRALFEARIFVGEHSEASTQPLVCGMSSNGNPLPTKPKKPVKDALKPQVGESDRSSNTLSARPLPPTKPPPPPPPPLPPVAVPIQSRGARDPLYQRVDDGSPQPSEDSDHTGMHESGSPTVSDKGRGRNPFRDSYKPEPEGKSPTSKKSNPFRDSYKEEDDVPIASPVAAPMVKVVGNGSTKKANPFEDERPPVVTVNPFDMDVQGDSGKGGRYSPKASPTVSRPNPILAGQKSRALGLGQGQGQHEGSWNRSDNGGGSSDSVRSGDEVVPFAGKLAKGDPGNTIYYLNRLSDWWLLGFLLVHVGQFILLLNVGYRALPDGGFAVVLFLATAVVVMVLAARWMTKRSRLAEWRNIQLNSGVCTPHDEADVVPDTAVLLLCAAAVTEGFAFAIFSSVSSGNYQYLDQDGFYTKGTLLQVLRFTSITLLALHRTLRPANRLDPMRTVLELEVIAVCWDALDGSTLYELLDGNSDISSSMADSVRALMAAWYVSVGFRMALMFLTNLSPTNPLQRMVITSPFQLARQPTVDRTLQGLRLKSIITITMAVADMYAAFLRTVIWSQGHLDALQQDMCIKNYMFFSVVAASYYNFQNTSKKEWNARELLDYPCEVKLPLRVHQLTFFRWAFVVSYAIIAGLATAILMTVTDDGGKWVGNLALDAFLLIIFLVYARNAHKHNPIHTPTPFFIPHEGFFTFPGIMASLLSVLLGASLMGARLPAMYYHYASMTGLPEDDAYTYDNAMLLVVFTIVPLACFGNYWSIAYMLFRREFTAAPGNYHAIHDPSINMVASATVVEGALDVLSAAVLMQLAANDLPAHVNNAIVTFCLLELINAGQCFALPCLVSGGKEDTPKDLVRYNAYLRTARGVIDFGTIVLRVVLWIKYGAVSSVFLVKNLYNLIHTGTQVDRHLGVRFYPNGTLFSEYVPSYDWYGMTRTQWREAIHSERSTASPTSVAGAVAQASSLRV